MAIFHNKKINHFSSSDGVFGDFFIFLSLSTIVFSTLYPFWHVLMYSISDSQQAMTGGLFFIPRGFSLVGYKMLFRTEQIFVAYKNTIAKTVIGTILSVFISALTAYPLSLKRFRGRRFLGGIIFFTMLFSGGIIPTYLVIKTLRLLDTFLVYVIPNMMNAYNMFILRNYFVSIPPSLEESAMLDGANPFQILFRIILPLAKPALAAIAMFYGVLNWNSYLDGILYVNSQKLQLLQIYLRQMIASAGAKGALSVASSMTEAARLTEDTMKMVVITVAVIPVLFVYPFLQKYYTKGALIGSVKG